MTIRALRIGIDARAAAEVPAGRGRFVRELIGALGQRDDPNRYVLYARQRWPAELDGRFTWRLFPAPDVLWHLRVGRRAARDCDVFFSTNSYLTAWFLGVPSALFIHDLIPFLPGAKARLSSVLIERATIRPALRRARRLICNSNSTRRDLVRCFPRVEAKTVVVPLAADPELSRHRTREQLDAVKARYALDRPFVLSVGTLEPRKNLDRLLQAYSGLPEPLRSTHTLVLVGPEGWGSSPALSNARSGDRDIRLLGHVPDGDLGALYALCELFCFPSLYEGFGLPLLEAMTAGAACVASGVSSLPEVGGDAVRYVDPASISEIRDAIAELLGAERKRAELGERARRRALEFSWERTADGIVRCLEELASP